MSKLTVMVYQHRKTYLCLPDGTEITVMIGDQANRPNAFKLHIDAPEDVEIFRDRETFNRLTEECPDCEGEGLGTNCVTCNGRGWIKKPKGKQS